MIEGDWSGISKQQIGRIAEYLARAEFTRQGYTVYVPDVDEKGEDILVHRADCGYVRVQVKCVRAANYAFMRKKYFQPVEDQALCLVMIRDDKARLFLIPATRWLSPDPIFVSRDYDGLKSAPEFGVSMTKAGLAALEEFKL